MLRLSPSTISLSNRDIEEHLCNIRQSKEAQTTAHTSDLSARIGFAHARRHGLLSEQHAPEMHRLAGSNRQTLPDLNWEYSVHQPLFLSERDTAGHLIDEYLISVDKVEDKSKGVADINRESTSFVSGAGSINVSESKPYSNPRSANMSQYTQLYCTYRNSSVTSCCEVTDSFTTHD